jgi:hypothetical protein
VTPRNFGAKISFSQTMRHRIGLLFALLAFGAYVCAPCALASSGAGGALADCNAHAQLTQTYSAGQLQSALRTMPADQKEYTDCYDVIQRALLADIGHVHAASGDAQPSGGSSFLSTPVIIEIVVVAFAAVMLGGIAIQRRRS